MAGLFSDDSNLLGNVVHYWMHCIRVISCHYNVNQKLFNIKLTWAVKGRMGIFHVYFFKSVDIYKHKLSRIENP